MAGLVVNSTNLNTIEFEFRRDGISESKSKFYELQVLATCMSGPFFLLTDRQNQYEHLKIIKIANNHGMVTRAELDLREIKVAASKWSMQSMLHKLGLTSNKAEQKSVYDQILLMKNSFGCQIQFRINQRGQIAIASILPSGFII
jgi:hypothetical protein